MKLQIFYFCTRRIQNSDAYVIEIIRMRAHRVSKMTRTSGGIAFKRDTDIALSEIVFPIEITSL